MRGPGVRRGWWRRNGLAVALVVVLIPATVGITFSNEWGTYYSNRPSQPVLVSDRASAGFGGAAWQVTSMKRVAASSEAGQDAALPTGSDLIVVTVQVTPSPGSPACELRLDERSGGDVRRSWGDAGLEPIDYAGDPDAETYCNTDVTTPYTLQTIFVVPSDAGSDGTELALNLQVVDQLPHYLEMTLPAS